MIEFTDSPAPSARFEWTDHPSVSFIVVTFGTGRVIDGCLATLADSLDGTAAEVIVVDNPHPQRGHRTADRLGLSTSGVAVVRPTRNLGFGGGNELGVLHSRASLVCFINPDTMFRPGWLGTMVDEVRHHPDAIVAPRLRNGDGSLQEGGQQLFANGRTKPIVASTVGGPEERAVVPDYASAACWMMTRTLHERCGGFDPRFHPAYFEDVDLALRVRLLGGHTRIADADVTHLLGGSTGDPATPSAETQRSVLLDLWADELRRQRSS